MSKATAVVNFLLMLDYHAITSPTTVYGPADSFRTQRILIASKYGGSDVQLDSKFKLGSCDQTPDFIKKYALGKVPAFEGKGGVHLVGSSAIASFVGKKIAGADEKAFAEVQQWVEIADSDFVPAVLGCVLPALSLMENNKKAVDASKNELMCLLGRLNDYLLTRTYLVGERVSLADVTLACNLLLAYQNVLEPSCRKQFVNVNRWFLTVVNQPNFKAVTGEVKLCDKATQFDAKKYAAFQKDEGGKGDAAAGKGKKEKQPQQEKKKEPEPKEEPDATEEALAAEPKKKDPFDEFPKTSFNFDEFKKVYSNEDTLTKAIPYFWDHFDKNTLSVWYCEYKYPEELTLTFMSCNLMGGMLQRLDKMRKHAFGSLCLFGSDNNSTISGVWFWRGDKLAFELSDDLQIDYSSYDWKKLDTADPNTKKLINEYFAWEGEFGGKKFNQGKIFK